MKLRSKENDFPIHISFIDTLFCTITFIKIITVMAIIMIDPLELKEKKAEEKILLSVEASLSISITWPAGPEDIDLWATGPDGRPVGYNQTRSETLGYLRDDTGINQSVNDSRKNNYELITAHGFTPGHYVVNVHYFAVHNGSLNVPVKVKILLKKKNEDATEIIYNDTVRLVHEKQEKTVLQFDLGLDGTVFGKTTEPKPLYQSLENRQ